MRPGVIPEVTGGAIPKADVVEGDCMAYGNGIPAGKDWGMSGFAAVGPAVACCNDNGEVSGKPTPPVNTIFISSTEHWKTSMYLCFLPKDMYL